MPRPRGRITYFGLHKQTTEIRLEGIEAFVRISRNAMGSAFVDFGKEFEAATAGLGQDERNEYLEQVYDELSRLRDESPQLLRQAHCMMLYGTFENILADLCRTVYRDKKIPNPPPEKIYTWTAKKYLEPHIAKRPAPFGKEWEWLDEFRIIRNWIAHNGARVQKDNKPGGLWESAQRFVNRNRGMIKFMRFREIVVEDALLNRAIRKTTDALARVHKATEHLYR